MKKIISIITVVACAINMSAQVKIDRSKAPEPAAAPPINIGDPAEYTLPNGLKVFVVENHKLPRVSFQLTIDNDPIMETGKVGYSSMAGDMLSAGTKNRTKAQIDEEVDFVGGDLITSSTGLYVSSLKQHTDKVLSIASDIILNPSFPQEELDKKKKQAISSLKNVKTDPNAMMARVKSVLLYGKDHPYGEIQTKSDINNITIEDCKEYYNTYYRPNSAYLVVVGDIKPKKALKLVEEYFGAWQKKDVPKHTYEMVKAPANTRVAFVSKPGAVQSVINVSYPIDLKPGSADEIGVKVMNSILGGGVFSGRLMQNLREDKAFTYGARSGFRANKLVGSFNAFASVRNSVTDSAVTEFLYEMNKIAAEPVTEDELQLVKNNMSGQFALSLESPQTIARFALNIQRYGLPKDYYQTYLQKIESITIKDVQAMAKKYVTPNNAWIVVVGNKDEADKLSKFAASGKVERYDFNGEVEENKVVIPLPEGLTAQAVIEKHLFAVTGETTMEAVKAKLDKIKDLTITMNFEMQGMQLEMISKQKAPNKTATLMNMNGVTMQKQVFDGKRGGASGMGGKQDLEGDDLESTKLDAVMHKELQYEALGYKLELVAIEPVNDKNAYRVDITNPQGDVESQYFDIATGFKVYTSSSTEGPDGKSMTVTSELSDYKEVDGIKYAHKRAQAFGPQSMDMEVQKVEVNTGIPDEDFAWE